MRKLEKRALFCIFFSIILIIGSGIYVYKYINHGAEWASYPANSHLYNKGRIITGTVKDRDGKIILTSDEDGNPIYNEDLLLRQSLLHITGDIQENISTGVNRAFRDKFAGYSLITGTYSSSSSKKTLKLTIDSELSKKAKLALGNYSGAVGIYNYKTGEILCMVSSPNYDPANPPQFAENDTSGAYINRITSSAIVPGSIFKLITSISVIDNIDDIDQWSYTCSGEDKYGRSPKDKVTCSVPHGKQDFKMALANSCNCAFGRLANDLGKKKLKKTIEDLGLTEEYNIDGIKTTPSSFDIDNQALNLAWSGIGQHKDLVNPLSMLVVMGAVANDGKAPMPYILKDIENDKTNGSSYQHKDEVKTLISSSTAKELKSMMKYNVEKSYGNWRFPGLDVYAKTGTAQRGDGELPHSWFTGFIDDEDHPYAFIVLVESGGEGINAAASITNTLLQYATSI